MSLTAIVLLTLQCKAASPTGWHTLNTQKNPTHSL